MNNKNNLPNIGPVKNYKPPKLPTLEDTGGSPPLKTLPSRWKKNTAVIACLGFAGALTLAGCVGVPGGQDGRLHNGEAGALPYYVACPTENDVLYGRYHNGGDGGLPFYVACPTENDVLNNTYHHGGEGALPYYVAYPTEQETLAHMLAQLEASELSLRTHWGGSGFGPFYVAHLTEQEVLGFIRAKLEAAGLNFDAVPPEHTVFGANDTQTDDPHGEHIWWDINEKGIDLFDATNNVAITSISWEDHTRPFGPGGRYLTEMVANAFSEQLNDVSFGVFYNPGETVGWGPFVRGSDDEDDYQEATPERKEEARLILIERLTAQVDEFIAWLQAEGIV